MSYFKKTGNLRIDQQFLAGGSFSNWIRLLKNNGGIDLRYFTRSLYVSAVALIGSPLRFYENFKYGNIIENTQITEPPIFILGHWRSGTTYVHQLMAQNPEFAVVTFIHTMIPGLFLTSKLFKSILSSSLPETRPMDNVHIGPNDAEEEEYALGNLGPYSFYHTLCFPRKMREIFDRYVIFEDPDRAVVEEWKKVYHHFLKKVTFSSGGKRLLLKNPANTARIREILELFPDAKFINVYRNPYVVYSSTMNWLDKELMPTALQDENEARIKENALVNYEKLMHRYFEDRDLIPEGNLVEVRFEDVEANPGSEVERIYNTLELTLNTETRTYVRALIDSLSGYKKNKYIMDNEQVKLVNDRWGFVANRLKYKPPQP